MKHRHFHFTPWHLIMISLLVGLFFILSSFLLSQFFPSFYTLSDSGENSLFAANTLPSAISDVKEKTELPSDDIASGLIPRAIKVALALFSVILTGVLIWSGVLYVVSSGDEEKVKQAKDLLFWSIIGVGVTATSYALISGIINLDFSN